MDTKELLKKVRKIEIKTRRLSDHIFSGEYHTSFKGRGMTFSEVRQYQFGDDVRAIDWNVTARYNEPYIKVFEEERELSMMLMVDVSGSESFGTQTAFKKEIIVEITFTIMVRLFTILFLFICSTIFAQTQYDQGMQKAFDLWKEKKNAEASALFERIAAAEKKNWLPNYYVALINTTQAFQTQDKEKIAALLSKAQTAQDAATEISPNNPELLVTQALIHTAWVVYDPMSNGMKLSGKINELYAKALAIAPNNPRVVFSKAEFDMGSASYFGRDTKPMCEQVERAVSLFATFKPESAYHPQWGMDRAQETLKECKK